MSLATRCTHCGTIFKIVQDQLKVSEGWVRCGRCNEIFNALPALFDLEREPPPPRPKPKTQPAPAPGSSAPIDPTANAAESTEAASTPIEPKKPIDEPAAQTAQATTTASPGMDSSTPADVLSPAPDAPAEFDWEKTTPFKAADRATAAAVAAQAVAAAAAAGSETAPSAAPIEVDLDPAPAAIEATTEFDLDTSVSGYVDKPSTVTRTVEALNLSSNPQPWLGTPPEEDVPATDESDALDSRYLMPSTRERKQTKRRSRPNNKGPEFADAVFPDDAFLDAADDEWASGFGNSGMYPTSPGTGRLDEPSDLGVTPSLLNPSLEEDAPPAPATGPVKATTTSSEFVPERALEPPSKRPGKPGTRGRDPAAQTPEFMRRAQRQAFWRHPVTRGVLSLITLGLLGLLGLQVTHQYRDLIAAHHPGTRPYIKQWCAYAGCSIKPPLRLDDLQVESATLVRANSEGPDNYRLAVVVHNRAAINLAWPNIDLTLTDEAGAVIARRAFSPSDAEWLDTADAKAEAAPKSPAAQGADGAKAAAVPEAAPADRSTTLLWHLRAPDIKPAGYTAELFYP